MIMGSSLVKTTQMWFYQRNRTVEEIIGYKDKNTEELIEIFQEYRPGARGFRDIIYYPLERLKKTKAAYENIKKRDEVLAERLTQN